MYNDIYTGVKKMIYSRTLSEEMDSILISSILETLKKTKDCELHTTTFEEQWSLIRLNWLDI